MQLNLFPETCSCPNCTKIAQDYNKMRRKLFAENMQIKKDLRRIEQEVLRLNEILSMYLNHRRESICIPFFNETLELIQ